MAMIDKPETTKEKYTHPQNPINKNLVLLNMSPSYFGVSKKCLGQKTRKIYTQ